MNAEKSSNESPKDEKYHGEPIEMTNIEALFASGEIEDVLKEAKLPMSPTELPDIAAVQKHKANRKRIPPQRPDHRKTK